MNSANPLRFARTLMASALAGASLLISTHALAADPIKVGILEDQSGNFAIAVIPKIYAYQLAVDEINAKGGVLGRQLRSCTTTRSRITRAFRSSRAG